MRTHQPFTLGHLKPSHWARCKHLPRAGAAWPRHLPGRAGVCRTLLPTCIQAPRTHRHTSIFISHYLLMNNIAEEKGNYEHWFFLMQNKTFCNPVKCVNKTERETALCQSLPQAATLTASWNHLGSSKPRRTAATAPLRVLYRKSPKRPAHQTAATRVTKVTGEMNRNGADDSFSLSIYGSLS